MCVTYYFNHAVEISVVRFGLVWKDTLELQDELDYLVICGYQELSLLNGPKG